VINRLFFGLALLALLAPSVGAQLEWDKPKTKRPFPNPASIRVARDDAVAVVKQILDENDFKVANQSLDQSRGVILLSTEPEVFTKGIVADTQFNHFAEFPAHTVDRISRGRVTLAIEIAPTNTSASTVALHCKFEGMTVGAIGDDWRAAESKGLLENELLCHIVARANKDTDTCNDDE